MKLKSTILSYEKNNRLDIWISLVMLNNIIDLTVINSLNEIRVPFIFSSYLNILFFCTMLSLLCYS